MRGGSAAITAANAESYLRELERALPPAKFSTFLTIIDEFHERRISTQEVVAKVKDILAGKPPSLITGFNLFLPTEYHIKPQKFDCALGMVKKIRDRFGRTEPSVLESFVEILVRSQEDSIAMVEARNQVRELFRGQDDLLQDFNSFIPEADESDSSSVIFKRMETGGCNIGSKHGLQDGGEKISAADKVGGSGQAKRKSMHKGMGDGGTSCKPGRGGEEPSHRRRLANISRPNVSGSSTSSGKRARKQELPQRVGGASDPVYTHGIRKKLFRMSELSAVLPVSTLQRAQTILRQIHT